MTDTNIYALCMYYNLAMKKLLDKCAIFGLPQLLWTSRLSAQLAIGRLKEKTALSLSLGGNWNQSQKTGNTFVRPPFSPFGSCRIKQLFEESMPKLRCEFAVRASRVCVIESFSVWPSIHRGTKYMYVCTPLYDGLRPPVGLIIEIFGSPGLFYVFLQASFSKS